MVNLASRTFDDTRTWPEADLRFCPALCDSPRRLTQDEIRFYNENGYLKGYRIFNEEQIAEHRSYFDRLLAKQMEDGGDSYSLRRLGRHCQPVWDIVTNPLILDYVEDLLGPDFVAWGTQYFCKLPGDGKVVSWHQDASYWPFTPAHSVTVWLAVDDSDLENGCMQALPGTHNMGHLDFDFSGAHENSVLPQKIKGVESLGAPVPFELKAGEISLHADMLVHGSARNSSNRRRCGLTVRYAAADVRALDDSWNKNSILCRGTDPGGYWANMPRPEIDYLDI